MSTEPTKEDIIVEDGNPSVSYSPGDQWYNLEAPGYHGGSIHISKDRSASISFSFFGQHLWYYADLNSDHGPFTVSVDNVDPVQNTSYSKDLLPAQLLYEKELDPGPHTIVITNLEDGKVFGLDYFAYRPLNGEQFENPNTQDTTVNADDSDVTYNPPREWRTSDESHIGASVYRSASSKGASVTFHFVGERIWYYSVTSSTHGAFQISVDGAQGAVFSAYSLVVGQTELLYTTAVSPGPHNITVTNRQDGKDMGLAYFVYRPLPTNDASTTNPPPTSLSASSSLPLASSATAGSSSTSDASNPVSATANTKLPTSTIAGVVLGVIGVILLVVLIVVTLRRRWRTTHNMYHTELRSQPYPLVTSTEYKERAETEVSRPFSMSDLPGYSESASGTGTRSLGSTRYSSFFTGKSR